MNNKVIFGASGFLGTHLKKNLSGNVAPVSLREKDWLSKLPEDADVFINCIGKAHDHKGTATEHDFYFANYELAKVLFEEFLKSNAQVMDYPFFDPENILVIDRNNIVLNSAFFQTNFKAISNETLFLMSLDGWIDCLFNKEQDEYWLQNG